MRVHVLVIIALVIFGSFVSSKGVLAAENGGARTPSRKPLFVIFFGQAAGNSYTFVCFCYFSNRFVAQETWSEISQDTPVFCNNLNNFGPHTRHIGFCLVWVKDNG